jgi:methyl-accepting chemotaxis protein
VASGLEATAALAQGSKAIAQQGARAAEASRGALASAAQNRAVVSDAVARLVDLKEFVGASAQEVAALGAVTRRITGFIGTIRELADATQLIALNAAIEAARAGRDGRGFAVVAEEVRTLAGQSLDAAREAGSLVGAIGERMERVTAQMDRGQEVVAGVEGLSTGAAQALGAIAEATGVAGHHAEQIAGAAADQVREFARLSGRIEDVAAVSRRARSETDALAREAQAAERGQADLERAIADLGEVSNSLQRIARHFAVTA